MKKIFFLAILMSVFFFSCKQEKKIIPAVLSEIQLTGMDNTSLPFLFSDGKDLLLSFVSEKDSLTTLYYSKLIDNSWSTPEAITSGTDWFVNWADYPQIAKNGNNYIAHILQKSDTATFAYDVMVTQKQEGGFWSTP